MNPTGSGISISMFNPGATQTPPNMGDVNSQTSSGANGAAKSYAFPPIVWMFVFLIVGYIGIHKVME